LDIKLRWEKVHRVESIYLVPERILGKTMDGESIHELPGFV
jgi:hypothetical protein